jgi:LPLT family lysophospholipid transporter-like MFS transporter
MTSHTLHQSLTSRGMIAVLIAQFLSALADNALLFAAIALLLASQAPAWQIPLLQEFFVAAFILLAPFVGPFADGFPKGRVMLIANLVKLIGASTMLFGLDPLISYGLVGLGAAAYSPAKYGILSEMVSERNLVKANGMMEGSTIVAILLGAVIGGLLADYSVKIALVSICSCYFVAVLANTLIPRLPAFRPRESFAIWPLLKDFMHALKTLFKQRDARLSLLGTSVFWGAGSTLRLLLIAWVPVALHIKDLSMPANLSGAVAIGIAIGATLAASLINLKNVQRVLPVGMAIGLLIMGFAHVNNLYLAIGFLLLIGICGGFYVVPLNALLQERGHQTVGAGNAVAVQNFVENCTMLTLIGFYVLLEKNNLPIVDIATIFGGVVFLSISLIAGLRLLKH